MAEQALLNIVNRLTEGQEAMNRQIEQRTAMLNQQAQLLEVERAKVKTLIEQQGQQSQSSRSGSVFDTRGIGRPPQFSGKAVEWTSWEFKLRSWLGAQFQDGEACLDWAQQKGSDEVTVESVVELTETKTDAARLDQQLWVLLVALCEQGTEALAIVKNSRKGSGLDAWRRLAARYDPSNPQVHRQLLRKVLYPRRVPEAQLKTALEDWERDMARYAERTSSNMSDRRLAFLVPSQVGRSLGAAVRPSDLIRSSETGSTSIH